MELGDLGVRFVLRASFQLLVFLGKSVEVCLQLLVDPGLLGEPVGFSLRVASLLLLDGLELGVEFLNDRVESFLFLAEFLLVGFEQLDLGDEILDVLVDVCGLLLSAGESGLQVLHLFLELDPLILDGGLQLAGGQLLLQEMLLDDL